MQFNRLKSKAYAKSKEAMADLEVEFEAKDEEKLAGYVKEITEKKQAIVAQQLEGLDVNGPHEVLLWIFMKGAV